MKKMFSEKEIQDALSGYAMEDEYFLNDDVKIMFDTGRQLCGVKLLCWIDERWVTNGKATIGLTGDTMDDRQYGIQLVMERAEALMRKFRFSQTYERTVTWREYYDIEAESLEEAIEKVKECDGDLDDCEDAEFVEAEEDVENDIDAYQYRDIDAIYDPDGEEVE